MRLWEAQVKSLVLTLRIYHFQLVNAAG